VRALRTLLFLSCPASLLTAADTEPRWRALNHAAHEAVQAKDYGKLRDTLRELRPLMPGNSTVVYNLAALCDFRWISANRRCSR